MTRTGPGRGVSLLVGLTVVITAGTLIQDFRFDRAIAREQSSALAADRELGSLSVALADLRAAEAAYLATGQHAAYWMAQASERVADIETIVRRRRATATHETTRKQYDAAAMALAAFVAVDGRVRANLRGDQQLSASDLVFGDAIQAIARVTVALDAARSAEQASSEDRLFRLRSWRFGLNAVAVAFVLAVALFFWRAVSRLAPAADIAADRPAPAALAPPRPSPPPPVAGVSLPDAAALCSDLARVTDARDVPPLFDRAASVLAAKGIVLWVVDPAGVVLKPSLTCGYSERVLAKLAPLAVDADTLTSLAYRSRRPQVTNGDAPGSPGAIAVPLVSASGCVGVLAAETRQQKPGHDVLPVAQMIAAQLAGFLTPGEVKKTG